MLKKTLLMLCVLAVLLSGAGAYAKINWSVKAPEDGAADALPGGVGLLFDRNGIRLEIVSIAFRDGESRSCASTYGSKTNPAAR